MKKLFLLAAALSINSASNAQWTSQATGFTNQLRGVNEIKIVDANIVWAKAYDGIMTSNNIQEFTRTIDGGSTWTPGTFNISQPTYSINNISPVSGTTAWISALDGNALPAVGGVWKTTDGGTTWTQQNTAAYQEADSFINGVYFFDANNGISYGDPVPAAPGGKFEMYKTTDGGNTWTAIAAASIPAQANGEYGYNGQSNVAAGNSLWLVSNKGYIYRTTDMGTTWTRLSTPITDFGSAAVSGDLKFSDNNNGVILGRIRTGTAPNFVNTYTLYKTTDGGNSWSTGAAYTAPYKSFSYIPGTSTLVGTGSTISGPTTTYYSGYSNDNGTTWTQIDTGVQRESISFLNTTTGWASGFNINATTDGIYKYTGPTLSITDFNSTTEFSVSPNPTSGNIKLYATKNAINNVTLYNMLGREVHNTKFNNLNNEVNIDLSTIDNGLYFMIATAENGGVQTIKIVKN
jgi:photosystem II stability/assembly factor-like uncharacterized protein